MGLFFDFCLFQLDASYRDPRSVYESLGVRGKRGFCSDQPCSASFELCISAINGSDCLSLTLTGKSAFANLNHQLCKQTARMVTTGDPRECVCISVRVLCLALALLGQKKIATQFYDNHKKRSWASPNYTETIMYTLNNGFFPIKQIIVSVPTVLVLILHYMLHNTKKPNQLITISK